MSADPWTSDSPSAYLGSLYQTLWIQSPLQQHTLHSMPMALALCPSSSFKDSLTFGCTTNSSQLDAVLACLTCDSFMFASQLHCLIQEEQFFPASSNALPEDALPPEAQGLTSNPLYTSTEIGEAEAASATQSHDLTTAGQGLSRVNASSQGGQANKRGSWRFGF